MSGLGNRLLLPGVGEFNEALAAAGTLMARGSRRGIPVLLPWKNAVRRVADSHRVHPADAASWLILAALDERELLSLAQPDPATLIVILENLE